MDVRRASFPAAGGIMNARSLARLYAWLDPEVSCREYECSLNSSWPMQPSFSSTAWMRFCSGEHARHLASGLADSESQIGPWAAAFGHAGAGGALGFADREQQFAYALTKNLIRPGPPGNNIAHKIATAIMEETL